MDGIPTLEDKRKGDMGVALDGNKGESERTRSACGINHACRQAALHQATGDLQRSFVNMRLLGLTIHPLSSSPCTHIALHGMAWVAGEHEMEVQGLINGRDNGFMAR